MNINLVPDEDERQLLRLKDGMSEQQRSDMAEIIQNELKRRENLSRSGAQAAMVGRKSSIPSSKLSSNLSHDDLGDIYKSSDKNIQHLRVQSLEKRLQEARKEVSKLGASGYKFAKKKSVPSQERMLQVSKVNSIKGNLPAIGIVILLLVFGVMRFSKDTNLFQDLISGLKPAEASSARASLGIQGTQLNSSVTYIGDQAIDSDISNDRQEVVTTFAHNSSHLEKGLLLQLDQRRVELEKRRKILDNKEQELNQQAHLVSEKVSELKTLITKLSSLRKEKDHKYNARMEQLASVYSAMAPHESASLISKLDNEVGLGLLERMPGKRMAQILGVMDQNRALELTKHLTNKKKL
jgi:flagellar motility protein MotE (MotC chaperone)